MKLKCPECLPYAEYELKSYGNDDFYHVCPECLYSIAICPECGEKMSLKFNKRNGDCYYDEELLIYQCKKCKNIEVVEA